MKKITYSVAIALCVALSACGSGDTGESYNSNEKGDLNPDPNAGLTDTVSSLPTGTVDTALMVAPATTDTGTTNVNRSGAR